MTDHLSTLANLNRQMAHVAETQVWIFMARRNHPTDQYLQLELDRKQSEVNEMREKLICTMADIPMRN